MKREMIGKIDKGGTFGGADYYSRVQLEDSDTPAEGEDDLALAARLFAEDSAFNNGPGARFCSGTRVVDLDPEERTFIGISFVRWDV